MKYEIERDFWKDFRKVRNPKLAQEILYTIEEVSKALSISDIPNIQKMKGHTSAYRIRSGNYRFGVFFENDTIIFAAFDHRSKIYKRFP